MNIDRIIDRFLPITQMDKRCNYKMQKKRYRRSKLRDAITSYMQGEAVTFDALVIGVSEEDILSLVKTIENA